MEAPLGKRKNWRGVWDKNGPKSALVLVFDRGFQIALIAHPNPSRGKRAFLELPKAQW